MNFIALDFETANRDRSSICQVGIATFRDGRCEGNATRLVDPRQAFEATWIAAHGINTEKVRGAPTFDSVYRSFLAPRLEGQVVVCHTSFDRVVIQRACERYARPMPGLAWLDSATLARRVWPEVSKSGFGLVSLAKKELGVEFRNHDAGENARVAGLMVVAAARSIGLSLEGCFDLFARKRAGVSNWAASTAPVASRLRVAAEPTEIELEESLAQLVEAASGLDDPPLAGETVVLTGKAKLERKDVGEAITRLGGSWEDAVTERTTMLVVGAQDPWKLNGNEKTAEHREAERLIVEGRELQLFGEAEWVGMLREIYGEAL